MDRPLKPFRTGRARSVAGAAAVAIAGFATAALIGVAPAKTFTLQVGSNNTVTNSRGFAVYSLTGDSKRHPKCTKANRCFRVWLPVTVSSPKRLSKAPGVKGKLGTWRRNGFIQVTLGGHPLYRFARDTREGAATGDGIRSFGGTWHVIKAASSSGGGTTMTTTGTTSPPMTTDTTTQTTTTNTTPCPYPPYC
jgi:predicted lipoprotein with Yx(FWY)xxD motif